MKFEPFRTALTEERDRVKHAIEYLHVETDDAEADESANESAADNHPGDRGTATFDREFDYGLEENAEEVLARIEAALGRIEDGSYGKCANCGQDIGEARLEARPWATLCIDCQRKEESGA